MQDDILQTRLKGGAPFEINNEPDWEDRKRLCGALWEEGRGKYQPYCRTVLDQITIATGMGSLPSGRAGYYTAGVPEQVTMATVAGRRNQSFGRHGANGRDFTLRRLILGGIYRSIWEVFLPHLRMENSHHFDHSSQEDLGLESDPQESERTRASNSSTSAFQAH